MWGLDVNITDDFFKASFSHLLKFGFSEKATKFEKIFVVVLTRCHVLCAQQRTCQKGDKDFSKQMWSSRIRYTNFKNPIR